MRGHFISIPFPFFH